MATSKASKQQANGKKSLAQRQRDSQRKLNDRRGPDRPRQPKSRREYRSPLLMLFYGSGLKFDHILLPTSRRDKLLRRQLIDQGIESKESVEFIILQLLFEARVLADWNTTDNLMDVFEYIKDKLDWASDIHVTILIQIFHAVLRARMCWLDKPVAPFDPESSCAVATRVDKLVKWIGGVDHIMEELDTFVRLTVPMAHLLDKAAMKNKRKKGKASGNPQEEHDNQEELVFYRGICMNAADVDINTRRRRPIAPPRARTVVPILQSATETDQTQGEPLADETGTMQDITLALDTQPANGELQEISRTVAPEVQRAPLIVPTIVYSPNRLYSQM